MSTNPTNVVLHEEAQAPDSAVDELKDSSDSQAKESSEHVLIILHPAVLRRYPLTGILAILLMIAGTIGMITFLIAGAPGKATLSLTFVALGGIYLLIRWLQSVFHKMTVTSKRTILRDGIISKRTSEVQHDDVRNIQVDQSIPARLLGIGDLAISSAGQDTLEIQIKAIPDPDKVVAMIRERQ